MLDLTTRLSHPSAGTEGRVERETGQGHGLEGVVIDGEETRRRNDGSICVRPADTATGVGGPSTMGSKPTCYKRKEKQLMIFLPR